MKGDCPIDVEGGGRRWMKVPLVDPPIEVEEDDATVDDDGEDVDGNMHS